MQRKTGEGFSVPQLENMTVGCCNSASPFRTLFLATLVTTLLFMNAVESTLVVDAHCGKLRGVTVNNVLGGTYDAYRGIPYGKPPLGNLRFADPIPAAPWHGVRDAGKYRDICVQRSVESDAIIGSEDCLYLNVYTKRNIMESGRKVPVMFWIHGGSFSIGSGDDTYYGADFLMRKDIVLVTINYRLQVFGFLSLEDEVAPGNQGLKDQLLALKWVRRNIARFGGDPDNVTIFGESSGACSVNYLALSPSAQGLFHKVIMQSGVVANVWALKRSPRTNAIRLAKVLGKESTDPKEIVDFLRSVDSRRLFNATTALVTVEEYLADLPFVFFPSEDYKSKDPIVPRPLKELARDGIKVPVLMGYNDREGLIFVPGFVEDKEKLQKINERFTEIFNQDVIPTLRDYNVTGEQLKKLYFGDAPLNNDTFTKFLDMQEDLNFMRGIHDIARLQLTVRPNVPIYFYEFSNRRGVSYMKRLTNTTMEGTTHADDLITLFYPYWAKDMNAELIQPGSAHYNKVIIMTRMWTDFATHGNPTPVKSNEAPVIWERLRNGTYLNLLHIDEPPKMTVNKVVEDRLQWNRLSKDS